MSFTREELRGIGIDDDKIEGVMSLHGQEIQSFKDKVSQKDSKLKELQTTVDSYKEDNEQKDNELKDLQEKAKNGDDLQQTISDLRQANQEKEEQRQKEVKELNFNHSLENKLRDVGARNIKAVRALLESDNLKFNDEDNEVIGLQDQLEKLRESDSYLFVETSNTDDPAQSSQQQQAQSQSSSYNPGTKQGNNGFNNSDEAIGKSNAQRLLGKEE
ncbi:phage scaffolding protein [Staphylococcus equorum]|uniref:Phage scaffolding protein n=1 Tax=Staphylococcus equorum TaxID=246432 RepID=A0A9X4L129_9STAP|nr:phage scaffolding protein [Staphylococcus equorum]MDG0818788.1 phage scaffolding protein [Staphylococcus equorum]MDG0839429.1 phage scaffolding protein [Staphylococcus equorum]MDG0844845.1 phage scaffolding protein [Staphylococcus equorum]